MIDFDRQTTAAKTAMIAVILAPATFGELQRPAMVTLGGKTLLQWSLDCAMNASTITEIVIVTDDCQTALAASRLGRGHKPVRVIETEGAFSPMYAVKRATEGR